ncbi:hypothetical protein M3Y98_00277000 [Aphelenchoides besseyi]|nr:hypothetical protein M3Y98_00277000 [Aphelenchoides besseyi]KAI6201004.1 hypothetical protein M3Y96_00794900 [Aphelenchoides besseyi]
MNSNVRNRNDVLTPFASSCGFANSRNSTDDQENIVPNQTVQPTPLFAQNNTLDSDDYAGPSSSTLNTVPAVSTEDQMADAISNLVIAIFGGAAEVFERDRSLLEMGYGDPDDFVNRKPLLTDLQQLRGFNLVVYVRYEADPFIFSLLTILESKQCTQSSRLWAIPNRLQLLRPNTTILMKATDYVSKL